MQLLTNIMLAPTVAKFFANHQNLVHHGLLCFSSKKYHLVYLTSGAYCELSLSSCPPFI